jgi:hypothetical protein
MQHTHRTHTARAHDCVKARTIANGHEWRAIHIKEERGRWGSTVETLTRKPHRSSPAP